MMRERKLFHPLETRIEKGITLLEASAGTGKTWSLTTVAVRLLVEETNEVPPLEDISRLLLVTFTRAATAELRVRLRERIAETLAVLEGAPATDLFLENVEGSWGGREAAILRRALLDFDRVRVQTIHSFCAQILRESAFETQMPLRSEESSDVQRLLTRAVSDEWRSLVEGGPSWRAEYAARHLGSIEDFVNDISTASRFPDAEWSPRALPFEEVDRAVRAALDAAQEAVDFDALRRLLEAGLCAGAKKMGISESVKYSAERLDLRASLVALSAADPTAREAFVLRWHAAQLMQISKKGLKEAFEAVPGWAALQTVSVALDSAKASLRWAMVEGSRARFAAAKRAAGVVDFDDLVQLVHERLADPDMGPRLRERVGAQIDVALIDEFQDTDARQWKVFRDFFAQQTLLLVGDPKQSIYGFRGADVQAYLQAEREARRVYTLGQNFRSHPRLVDAVVELYRQCPGAFLEDGIEIAEVTGARGVEDCSLDGDTRPPLLLSCVEAGANAPSTLDAVLDAVAEEVETLLSSGLRVGDRPLREDDLAILVRSHFQARRVREALAARDIHSVLQDDSDIHASDAMRELEHILRGVLDPTNRGVLRRAVATRIYGGSAKTLFDLLEDDVLAARTLERFDAWRQQWRWEGILPLVHSILEDRDVLGRWLGDADGERRFTDLRHAAEVTHAAALRLGLSPEATVQWMRREADRPHVGQEDRLLRLESDEHAVRVATVHACKGLEYEVTLVPFAWTDSTPKSPFAYHAADAASHWILHWGSEHDAPDPSRIRLESRAEDQRLLYVALTRARRRCVVLAAGSLPNPQSAKISSKSALAMLLRRPSRQKGQSLAAWVDAAGGAQADYAGWQTRFDELARDHDGIGWMVEDRPTRTQRVLDDAPNFDARPLPSRVLGELQPWGVTSFTHLVRGMVTVGADVEDSTAERADPSRESDAVAVVPRGIFAFTRGARAGIVLHALLEHSDFTRVVDDSDRERAASLLRRHGLDDPRAHAGAIDPLEVALELIETVRAESFPIDAIPLSSLDLPHRLDEWGFRAALGRVVPAELARVFAAHAEGRIAAEVAPRLARLSDKSLRGLLGGFVDLVFEHGERWYLVDWKSNHLGDTLDDYADASLWRAMVEHDYVLQMVLYAVALHRYLRVRIPDYDYDTHFGGAAYCFLRGLCGRSDRGWFEWRPPRALVLALDDALAGGTRP